ncbi:hypothetical protein P280DRAFT_404207 [Massarina eburnea CBS 473.64]|uniref:P-loop containing nucleoside triphosphate hydrolase protein n=1 Tax=Massarina eburnea CBS 473.64 TaxID=1395130 RepID=A0A6A6RT96_9PLEO|nr:hypothetical protein P280DRAFT_404207 [Massarina eburnea CBS 473.64]
MRRSRSPTPLARRRSGSRIEKEIHRPEDEVPPKGLFHTKEVQDTLSTAKSMMSKMSNVLSSSNLHQEPESSVEKLFRQAKKLRDFELHSSRTVGLVGDTGAGKSSLINSLLDHAGLARASSSGVACTCVVTEYHYHERDDFIIHIDYFTLDELKTQYENLLRAYRDYQALASGSDKNTSQKDKDSLKQHANLASATFSACFGDMLERTPAILSSLPFDHAIKMMLDWTERLLPSQSVSGNSEQQQFNSVGKCSVRLGELTSQIGGSTVNNQARTFPWPFVKKLRVYLKSYILSNGLVIADLPVGLRDSNAARQNITERYIRKCHQILVVAEIGRAVTDQSVKDIFDMARHANLSHVSVVCTKSDNININEGSDDWPSERETINAMKNRIKVDTKRVTSLAESIGAYEDYDEDLDEEEELLCARLRREHSKVELHRHIITVRNTHVSKGIQNAYRNHPAASNVQTFCVSNKLYWDNRNIPATQARPRLELSGIIGLRRYCIGIVAESHLRVTRAYIIDEIPAFFSSTELWLEANSGTASAESKRQILEVVSAVEAELDEVRLISPVSQLNELSESLQKCFKAQVQHHMQSTSHISRWIEGARQASMIWQGWHHASYKAFCRNYGKHSTPTVNYHCWNEEAMMTMFNDMESIWNAFTTHLLKSIEQAKTFVETSFQNAICKVVAAFTARSFTEHRRSLQLLAATLHRRKSMILRHIESFTENSVNADLSALRTDAFSFIRTAFVGQLMEDTYHAANMDCGSGSDRRRKLLVSSRFSSRSLFDEHRQLFKEAFIDLSYDLEDKVTEVVYEQVELIEMDLDLIKSDNVVLESERNPRFCNAVREEVVRAKSDLESMKVAMKRAGE